MERRVSSEYEPVKLMAFHKRANLVFIKWRQSHRSVNTLTSDGTWYIHAHPVARRVHVQWYVNETSDKAFLQSKQSLLEEREEIRLTLAAKVTRKTQKSMLANKETEAATNDKCVRSSHSEYTAVGECGKRTKTMHATIEFRLACGPCGRFETLCRCWLASLTLS